MKIVTEHGIHDDFAQVLCVDDDDLLKIRDNVSTINEFSFIIKLLDKTGDNAVIVRLELKNRHNILKHMKCLLNTFKSVSWVHNGKLFTRRKI